ncbi:prepilin-type N-terminal cleavage/methylation domain-containing protein [Pontibacillus salipaludis]|uniref:Type IV pilus assembly protein PilA n=1 Tax=Pontibacillus salipaludis TaxID=1697394 RepID=A0ABQ1PTS0_9BACI|nr:prepilin-type N-terminal cleavage/methylation domain-containing protein [Pontibacillus salipaludis]GGD03506.1 hypothetical protein GCM10011389_08780 [Pontibacillus salipaludis]
MLKKFRQLMNKDEKGFTLVELLAVIVILGIIAAIAIPSIANVVENGKKDSVLRTAEQAVESYRLMYTAEPSNEVFTDATNGMDVSLSELSSNGYLENTNDFSGTVTSSKDDAGKVTYNVNITNGEYKLNTIDGDNSGEDMDSATREHVDEDN